MSQRKARVEHALRDVLTELIASEVKDPRVRAAALVTVTKVELNVDLAVANVYVSIVSSPAVAGGSSRQATQGVSSPASAGSARQAAQGGDAVADGVIAGLMKAAGFLRGPVARRLSLQRAPELRFHQDVSVDMNEKLAAILREDEEKARAAGRGAAAEAAVSGSEAAAPGSEAAAPGSEAAAREVVEAAKEAAEEARELREVAAEAGERIP